MNKLRLKPCCSAVLAAITLFSTSGVGALVIEEDFTKGVTKNRWYMPQPGSGITSRTDSTAVNEACLTAGTGSQTASATVSGTPGACATGKKDDVGSGALRLTPATNHRVGGIVSEVPFPTNEGVEITFTTYVWGGNGADGMSFYLLDADRPVSIGANGGSLGYTCANDNPIYSGVDGGYLAIGMDEFGNFVNGPQDSTSTGVGKRKDGSWVDARDEGRYPEFKYPNGSFNAIGIRGAGKTNINYMLSGDFLRDLYRVNGWGTVPTSKLNDWKRAWEGNKFKYFWTRNPTPNLTETALSANQRGWCNASGCYNLPDNANNKNWLKSMCRTGTLTITPTFLPDHIKSNITLSADSKDPKRKLYNYEYIDSKRLPVYMWTDTKSRSTAVPIQYRIKITPDNKGTVQYSWNGGEYQTVIKDRDLASTNGALPRAFRFAFVGSTGGSHNNHEVTCFKAAPSTQSEGSASVNLPNARVVSDTQVYLSLYNPYDWSGQLLARTFVHSGTGDNAKFGVNEKANWDAACNLNGGACKETGAANTPKQTSRKFFTWNGVAGTSLEWGNLTQAQKASLYSTGETETTGQQRLDYIKGDRSQEQVRVGVGKFRVRNSVLGDIINSSPVWVGYPSNMNYHRIWNDLRGNAVGDEKDYRDFADQNYGRVNAVYAGSNDGFLHAFRSGNYNSSRQFDTKNNDGQELFAFMPSSVLQRMHNKGNDSLDFSNSHYGHNFYNDASPATGDVYYNGKWHTWLLSGLGAGGSSVYALDITEPDKFSATNVIGEWSNTSGGIWSNLGNTYGTPVFGRFHDGTWGAVFGNGWCSKEDATNGNCTPSAGPAGIYVMSINKQTGVPSFRFISTNVGGTVDAPNGIAYVTPTDVDGDLIYDYAYAGDLKGNVWRFDLTDNTGKAERIFTTRAGQPITTKIVVSTDNGTGGDPVLNFGTGHRQEGYLEKKASYAKGTQSLYGLRDRTAVKFAPVNIIGHNQLQQQTVSTTTKAFTDSNGETHDSKTLSTNKVDWTKQHGWYMDLGTKTYREGGQLVTQYEQIIYSPYLSNGKYLIVNSYIDGSSPLLSCDTVSSSGVTYPLLSSTGSGIVDYYKQGTGPIAALLGANGTVSLLKVTDSSGVVHNVMVYKTPDGKTYVLKVNLPRPPIRRVSWREIF